VEEMAVLIGETVLMMESEVSRICPANRKWAKAVLQTLPISSILKSDTLKGLLTCVGPEVGLKVKVAKNPEEFEKLKKELEAEVEKEK